jgi:arylsulfatase A-like enzyme
MTYEGEAIMKTIHTVRAVILGIGLLASAASAQAPPRAAAPPVGPPQDIVWAKGPATAPKGKRKPNIILIVADDLGFNDLTFDGGGVAGGSVPTPNIDSLAREGVSFAQGYTAHGTCAPSRAALMTGRYGTRFGYEFTPTPPGMSQFIRSYQYGIRNPVSYPDRDGSVPSPDRMGVPETEVTLAEALREVGYYNVHIGKWHLGSTPNLSPRAQGFDEALEIPSGGSLYLPKDHPEVVNAVQTFDPIDTFLWNSMPFAAIKDGGPRFAPKRYTTDYFTDEAIRAVEANRNRPFFLYMAYFAPHNPLQASRADYDALAHIKDHRLRVYAAMIRSLDRNVGRLLGALEENGLEKDTIVMFVSDNGGAHYIGLEDINKPFRGWKQTFFEGGIRTPYFIKWPGVIPAGTRYQAPVHHFDLFSTALAAGGGKAPSDRVIDGVDLTPFVRGEKAGRPHQTLFWRTGAYKVVRSGDWKLQTSELPKKDWLFDLALDPTERRDLAGAMPEKVAELKALIARHDQDQAPPLWPELGASPVSIDHSLASIQMPEDDYVYWGN